MTPNQAKIVIENPCSQSWDEMKADAIGRFCQSCQKSVIDFTGQSDEEIKAFLKEKQGKHVCGRFYNHQLHRIRIEIDQNILASNIPFWQKFLVVLLVCFGSDFLGIDFAFAQTETDSIPVKTEQIDSLVPLAITEPDSVVEVSKDSLIITDLHYKWHERIVLCDPEIIAIMGQTMGMVYIPPVSQELIPIWYPELRINHIDSNPEIPQDILVKKPKPNVPSYETVQALKHLPIVPKHPKKKPVKQPENAILADNGERRKTRRS